MTLHLFLTPDSQLLPRWKEAFSDARSAAHLPADTAVDGPTVVWVSTLLDGWAARVAQARSSAGVPVVVISQQPCQAEGLDALDAGAQGYCHALATPAMLREVALVVGHGGLWVGPELVARAIRATASRVTAPADDPQSLLSRLSEREREVASAVSRGLTNKEVAAHLAITERTVKAHLSAIFEKLAVRDRMQLALMMMPAAAATVSAA
ncbi:MAG: DNA-binding response regulator [Betaproteobacteria bacterium HGW-Betaproteobacteria-21]|nr:MAG: DNA-binding response regulator [Betaproteobacteria bacterium HGW-Betaproteobacteria-21]